MNFGIEHLYHDSDIPSNFTSLDVKEKLKTRQRNARDEKQLKKLSSTLQRAQTVLIKRQEWEKNNIQQELHVIKLKTESLENGLKREEEAESNQSQRLPHITSSNNSLIKSNLSDKSSACSVVSNRRNTKCTALRRHGTFTSTDLRYSAEVQKMPPVEICVPTNTVYMKKADIVTRNLHRLYKRKRERTFYIKQAVEIIRQNNQNLLSEAKFYTRNKELFHDLKSHTQKKNAVEKDSTTKMDDKDEQYKDEGGQFGRDENGEIGNDECEIDTTVKNEEKISGDNGQNIDTNNNIKPVILRTPNSRTSLHLEPISSVVVNASESSVIFDDKNSKWMDIFRIPEMWKLFDNRKKVNPVVKPTPPAIVTIRGKLRKTLLR